MRSILLTTAFAAASVSAPACAQTLLTANFTRAAIAEYQNNANQTDNAQLISSLGISSVSMSQVSANGLWGGTQGNDTAVTVTLHFANGTTTSFPAAVNWVRNANGSFHWIGLTIDPSTVVPDGFPVPLGRKKTYILQFSQSGLSLAALLPNDLDGSANAGQALTALNQYVPFTPPAPVITGPSGGAGATASAVSVNENQTAVTTLTADKPVTWAITGGSDQGRFSVSAGGAITFVTAPDYEQPSDSDVNNTYVLTVEATAADGQKAAQTMTVTVLDLADVAPVITGPSGGAGATASAVSVNENQTAVTTLTADKPVTWAITGGTDQGRFSIGAGGAITFNAAPDYEQPSDSDVNNTYVLTVEATAADGRTAAQTVTVTVLDLADVAPVITGPSGGAGATASAVSVNENQTAVATLTSVEAVTWAIVGGNDRGRFSISAAGVITFNAAPDYDQPSDSDADNTYVLTVEALAADGRRAIQTVTVRVVAVDELTPKLAEQSGRLQAGVRQHVFDSLHAGLAVSEGLLRETAPCRRAAGENRPRLDVAGSAGSVSAGLRHADETCLGRTRLSFESGVHFTSRDGDSDGRAFGAVRLERAVRERLTLGAAFTGTFGDEELHGYAASRMSEKTAQLDVFVRYGITDALRTGAFVGFGRGWYDFRFEQDGLEVAGEVGGRRKQFGAMLSGDLRVGRADVTVDAVLSRAEEDLDDARLAATFAAERRSGVPFRIGTVEATRVSLPAHVTLLGGSSDARRLDVTAGFVCEDRTADDGDLVCGGQIGGRYAATVAARYKVDAAIRREELGGRTSDLFSVAIYRFVGSQGLQAGLELDARGISGAGGGGLMLRVRRAR